MAMSMKIRTFQKEDLDDLLVLYRHLNHGDDDLLSPERARCVCDKLVDNPIMNCFVGDRDGQLVSTCTLSVMPNLTRAGCPYGLIENVVTHGSYQRQGYGKAVIHHALNFAWQLGCYKVMLLCNSDRHYAHQFYRACGFRADQKMGFIARP